MSKTNGVPYGKDMFDVDGLEFCQWEDMMDTTGGDPVAIQWGTYDFLIGLGYFISEPSVPRPDTNIPANTAGRAGDTDVMSPGFRDSLTSLQTVASSTREPIWTQSKILAERDKLLKEREKMLNIKEAALQRKIDYSKSKQGGTSFSGWVLVFRLLALAVFIWFTSFSCLNI